MKNLILALTIMLSMDYGTADMLKPSSRAIPNVFNDLYNDSDTIQQFSNIDNGIFNSRFNDI